MDTTSTLDFFQLIVGTYFIFTAIKGDGNMYNFIDVSDEYIDKVHNRLRIVYAVCGVIALVEAGICMWKGVTGSARPLTESQVNNISVVMPILIVAILIVTLIWIRKISGEKK